MPGEGEADGMPMTVPVTPLPEPAVNVPVISDAEAKGAMARRNAVNGRARNLRCVLVMRM